MRHLSAAHAMKLERSGKRPERQRGDWSFLTWAFFLPHLVATEVFFGKGAKAADQDSHGGVASDSATNTALLSDSPLNPVSPKGPDVDARQSEGSASSNSQTALSDLKIDTQQSGPSGMSAVLNGEAKAAAGGGGGSGSVSFGGHTLTTDGSSISVSADSPDADSRVVDADITPDQFVSLPPSIISGMGETPDDARNGLNPTGPSESDGSHGLGPSSVSSSIGPGFLGDAQVGLATGVHVPDSSTTPALDIFPGFGASIDVKGLLGFDLQLNGDGLSVGGELGTGSLSDLLGFDLHVTADGIFAGLNLGAPLLTPMVTGVAEGVENVLHATATELGSMLSLDGQLGSALLPGLLGGSGLPIMGGETPSQPLKDLLADATGVQVLGGLESSQLISKIADVDGPLASVTGLASGQNEVGQVAALSTHIMSDLLQVAGLKETGVISSGDAFHFAAQPPQQIDALFAGQQYTDYNVTLQSSTALGATVGGLVSALAGQAAETVSSIMHPAESAILQNTTDNHQEAAQHDEQLNANSLLHTTLSVVHLTSH